MRVISFAVFALLLIAIRSWVYPQPQPFNLAQIPLSTSSQSFSEIVESASFSTNPP